MGARDLVRSLGQLIEVSRFRGAADQANARNRNQAPAVQITGIDPQTGLVSGTTPSGTTLLVGQQRAGVVGQVGALVRSEQGGGRAVLPTGAGTIATAEPVATGVTSVGLIAPAQFSVSGSPVVGAGNLTLGWANQNPNLVLAGPAAGNASAPTFRSLVAADLYAAAGNLLIAGNNITLTGNAGNNTIAIASTGGGGGGASLIVSRTNLREHWRLNENGGTRTGALNSYALAVTGTVARSTQIPGYLDFSAEFGGGANYLQMADNSNLRAGGDTDVYVSIWARPTNLATFRFILAKDGPGPGNRDYVMYYDATNQRWSFGVFTATDTIVEARSNTLPLIDTWHLLQGWYIGSLRRVFLQVNNEAINYTQLSAATQAGGAGTLTLGYSTRFSDFGFVGQLAAASIWIGSIPNQIERALLYQQGVGYAYPWGN